MNEQRRQALRHKLALIDELKAISQVKPHDSRFKHEIALVAPAEVSAEVDAVVQSYLSAPVKSAAEALPARLKGDATIGALGGIRADQTLFMVDLDEVVTFYVAYWPWGGGARFTIKVGAHLGQGATAVDQAGLDELIPS